MISFHRGMLIFELPVVFFPITTPLGPQGDLDNQVPHTAGAEAGSGDQNQDEFPIHKGIIKSRRFQCHQKSSCESAQIP